MYKCMYEGAKYFHPHALLYTWKDPDTILSLIKALFERVLIKELESGTETQCHVYIYLWQRRLSCLPSIIHITQYGSIHCVYRDSIILISGCPKPTALIGLITGTYSWEASVLASSAAPFNSTQRIWSRMTLSGLGWELEDLEWCADGLGMRPSAARRNLTLSV